MSSPLELTASLYGLHALLVDDDIEVREAMASLLEGEGMRITALAAAERALDALAGPPPGPFDLLLTDVILGGPFSGFDVASAARERFPALPIVLATGYAGPAGDVPAWLAGSVPLLLKPFRRIELLAAIAAARDAVAARPPVRVAA